MGNGSGSLERCPKLALGDRNRRPCHLAGQCGYRGVGAVETSRAGARRCPRHRGASRQARPPRGRRPSRASGPSRSNWNTRSDAHNPREPVGYRSDCADGVKSRRGDTLVGCGAMPGEYVPVERRCHCFHDRRHRVRRQTAIVESWTILILEGTRRSNRKCAGWTVHDAQSVCTVRLMSSDDAVRTIVRALGNSGHGSGELV
jgi:hypothetical protein